MGTARAETEPARGLAPDSRLTGEFRPTGSKSQALRVLLAAALARGETEIEGLSEAEDVRAACALLSALGVPWERSSPTRARVTGLAASGLRSSGPLNAGESGTLARLATAVLAFGAPPGSAHTVTVAGSLLFRRSLPLFQALRSAGVGIGRQNLPGTWPVELVSAPPPRTIELVRPVSSQEVSGLLLALAVPPGERELLVRGAVPSAPYLELTRRALALFGAPVRSTPLADGTRFEVAGPLRAPPRALELEPDASSAAVVLAAAVLSGGEVRVPGLARGSPQGDVRIVAHLAAFGCDARFEDGALSARGFPTRGAELDLAGEPDLAPVLAAVAAGAALRHGAPSVLCGLATLPGKESDRIAVLAAGLGRLGFAVEAGVDALRLERGRAGPDGGPIELDPHGDHRMVFAFALLGLLLPGVRVRAPGCVAKSWSSFWGDLERLGARVER